MVMLGFDPPKTTSVRSNDPDPAVVDEIPPIRRSSPRNPEVNPSEAGSSPCPGVKDARFESISVGMSQRDEAPV
jgi:hypothetical protein